MFIFIYLLITNTRNNMLLFISVEHIFEVVIEGLRGLTAFENMMWGEADCFVQYHFPAQTNNQVQGAPVIKHGQLIQ